MFQPTEPARRLLPVLCTLFLGLFLSIPLTLLTQNQHNVWVFGRNAGIDFNGGPPANLNGCQVNTTEGSASICDSLSGALLLYSDGQRVWNRNHGQMPNGFGLTGNGTTTQSSLILPQPGNPGIYYIISVPYSSSPNNLSYSIVDMSLQGGLGDVTIKNTAMSVGNTVSEKITAIRHCNGIDWWVITHEWGSNNYLAWLLSSAGMSGAPVSSGAGTVLTGGTSRKIGYLTPSNDGERLAFPIYGGGTLDIVDFDNSTGTVSNPIVLTGFAQNYGTCFSPDNQVLYVTNFRSLYQFNLASNNAAAIQASRVTLATESNWMRAMRLGPDENIYVVREFQANLGRINSPNTPGFGANYTPNGFNLSPNSNSLGIANTFPWRAPTCIVLNPEVIQLAGRRVSEEKIALNWSISDEIYLNGANLSLQRSPDGENWKALAHQTLKEGLAKGQTFDEQPLGSTSYYRFLLRDANGQYTYSNVAEVAELESGFAILNAFPTPTRDYLNIEWSGASDTRVYINVLDLSGRSLKSFDSASEGSHARLDVSDLSKGLYILRVRNGGSSRTLRFIRQ